jgi:8-amino-7-oxononanoate synthase
VTRLPTPATGLSEALRSQREARDAAGLTRVLRPRESSEDVVDLASNDYLGLSRDPRVVAAAVDAVRRWGAGSTGSRLVTGSTRLHADLEGKLAEFTGGERALVFSSGYLANVGTIAALSGRGTTVVSDAGNHASIVDGCRLSRADVVVVPHRDVSAVEGALTRRTTEGVLVVTDAVFSVDGDRAPLAELYDVTRRHGALLLVDEAHALGVVGPGGRGAAAEAGIAGEPDVAMTLTLSKSLGAQGGAVVGSAAVVEHLVNSARTFVFDTALAPSSAGAALAALGALRDGPGLADRVRANATRLAEILGTSGRAVTRPDGAVVSVLLDSADEAVALAAAFLDRGVRVGCFRPPSVPDGRSRLRLTARADLVETDFARLAEAVAALL